MTFWEGTVNGKAVILEATSDGRRFTLFVSSSRGIRNFLFDPYDSKVFLTEPDPNNPEGRDLYMPAWDVIHYGIMGWRGKLRKVVKDKKELNKKITELSDTAPDFVEFLIHWRRFKEVAIRNAEQPEERQIQGNLNMLARRVGDGCVRAGKNQ